MAVFYNIIAFLGGLSMLLYGMRVMGDGLKSSSGGAMKNALAKVTNKPVMGFILGMLVACIIQSFPYFPPVGRYSSRSQRRYRYHGADHQTHGREFGHGEPSVLLQG